jgi:8-amino-7-oxononanoate synthase
MAKQLRDGLKSAGFDTGPSTTQIVPVLLGGSERALETARLLRKEGLEVRAIRAPTVPEGAERLRLSVTADLPPEAIDCLLDALVRARDRVR